MFPRIFHQTIRDFAVNSVFKLSVNLFIVMNLFNIIFFFNFRFSSNTSRILTFTSANSLKYNHTDIFHRQPLGDQKTEFQIHINKNMRVSRENKL